MTAAEFSLALKNLQSASQLVKSIVNLKVDVAVKEKSSELLDVILRKEFRNGRIVK